MVKFMYCKKCGTELRNEDNGICPNCHNQTIDKDKLKFLPSFILGLIASLFGISGGFCMSVCSSLYSSGMSAFVLILGGSVLGLVGACQCLKNVRLGSVLQLIAAVMITICAYGKTGGDLATIIAMLLFYISGIIGMCYYFIKLKK